MNGWQGYARFERRERRLRCALCVILGFLIGLVVLVAIPAMAHGGRTTDELYVDHKANLHQCFYADPSRAGVVACSDPAANPCTAGVFCVPEEDRCHTHSAELMLGGKTQACIDFETPPPPPPPPVVPPPDECTGHWCDHERWGEHETHDCAICDDQNGTCGWERGHRHPGVCPDVVTDPPVESCTCCEDVQVTQVEGETCEQTCASLVKQVPDSCPVDPPVDPPATGHSDDHPRWGVHEEADHSCSSCDDQNGTCGWWGGHRHPAKCPNKELENVECGRASQHRHADAFENRCHSEEHQHGYVGCNWDGGPGGHKHDGLACHNATDSHEDPPPVVDKPRSEGGSGAGGGGTREVVVPPARTVEPVVDETPVTPYDPPEEEAEEVRRQQAIEHHRRNAAWLHALD